MAALRRSYALGGLSEADLAPDWETQFGRWFDDALAAGLTEPNAMVLGTIDPEGRPEARTVLLKGWSGDGFVFYSNRESFKGRALAAHPLASLVFPWIPLERQVVVSGSVHPADDAVSDSYFASRPRGSQLGAWASPQSRVVADRDELARSLASVTSRFGADPSDGPVPRPPHWGGFVVVPRFVEFWQGRQDRMHDRLRFTAVSDGDTGAVPGAVPSGWRVDRLAP